MAEPTKIQIVVETSASTKALETYKKGLEESVSAARTAGLSTKSLEKELSAVNHELAASKLKDYRASLVQHAEAARKAGQDTAGFDRQLRALDATTPATRLQRLGSALKEAASQIPGVGAFTTFFNGSGKAVAAFAGIVMSVGIGALLALLNALKNVTATGVAFNSTLENAQLGIAAVMKQFDETGKFANFDAAMVASAEAIEMLKQKALESPATFEQLVQAYQGTAGAMAASGMSIQQQVNTIVTMSQTLAGLGIRSEQILQETRAILTGNITEDAAAARILGITRDMIATAQKEGQLYEFLQQRMSSFAEAGVRSADTLTTKMSNLGDSFQQISARLSTPFFDSLKYSADEAQKALNLVKRAVDFLSPPKPEAAKGVNDIAEKAREAEIEVRKLNNARVDQLKKSADAASDSFVQMERKIRDAAEAADKLDEAETKRSLAELDLKEQQALAAAGNDSAARSQISADFNSQRSKIQSDREGRRGARDLEVERGIEAEINKGIISAIKEAISVSDEASRAREGTRSAEAAARQAGLDPNTALSPENINATAQRLAQEVVAAEVQLKEMQKKWAGISTLSEGNRVASAQEIGDAQKAVDAARSQQGVTQGLGDARNYQAIAEQAEKDAKTSYDRYAATANPQLEEARGNIKQLEIEEQTRLLKEQSETAKQNAVAQKAEDDRHMKALQDQAQLLKEQNETALGELRARGATEQEIADAKAKGNEAVRQIELDIAKIRGDSERATALADEQRKQDALVAARQPATTTSGAPGVASPVSTISGPETAGPLGRSSAPLQQSPFGRSGLNVPVSVTDATTPRDLAQELTPKGSSGYGTNAGPAPGKGGTDSAAKDVDKASEQVAKIVEVINKLMVAFQKGVKDVEKAADPSRLLVAFAAFGMMLKGKFDSLEKQIDDLRRGL
jgi:hypothetical protein